MAVRSVAVMYHGGTCPGERGSEGSSQRPGLRVLGDSAAGPPAWLLLLSHLVSGTCLSSLASQLVAFQGARLTKQQPIPPVAPLPFPWEAWAPLWSSEKPLGAPLSLHWTQRAGCRWHCSLDSQWSPLPGEASTCAGVHVLGSAAQNSLVATQGCISLVKGDCSLPMPTIRLSLEYTHHLAGCSRACVPIQGRGSILGSVSNPSLLLGNPLLR